MGSISLRNAGVIATEPLFSNLDIVIAEGDRLGLVAGNGRGKTTLLRAMAGLAELTTGDIVRSRGLTIGYVEQHMPADTLRLTLRDAVLEVLPEAERDFESWRVDVALDEFDTPAALRDSPVSELSGGWQRIALIARTWVQQPDMLLLDEPTNHLDLTRLSQLERWLASVPKSVPVVIASHDRQFLDNTTNRTLFLRPAESVAFALPFSRARIALAEAHEAAEAQRERVLREAERLRKQAAKLTNIGINSGSDLLVVKSRYLRERAARIEAAVAEVHRERSGDIRLANAGAQAKVMMAFEDVQVTAPGGRMLFGIDKLHIFQGDRVVLLGANGTGKSQLLRLVHRALCGESVAGLRTSPQAICGYLDQALSLLPEKQTPTEVLQRFDIGDQRRRSLLAGAGFSVEHQGRRVGQLSYGQRTRLGLLVLRLTEPNLYLLDEPTNHLDIPGQERLEDEIVSHGATCLLVSHDRSFVRGLGSRFLQIEGKRLREVDSPEAFFMAAGRT